MNDTPAMKAWAAVIRPAIYGDSDAPAVVLDDPVARLLKSAFDAVSAYRGIQAAGFGTEIGGLETVLARETAAFTEALAEVRGIIRPRPMQFCESCNRPVVFNGNTCPSCGVESVPEPDDVDCTAVCDACKSRVVFGFDDKTWIRTCPACGERRAVLGGRVVVDPAKSGADRSAAHVHDASCVAMEECKALGALDIHDGECSWCGERHEGGPENCPGPEVCAGCKYSVEFVVDASTGRRTCPTCGYRRPPRLDESEPDAVNAVRVALSTIDLAESPLPASLEHAEQGDLFG